MSSRSFSMSFDNISDRREGTRCLGFSACTQRKRPYGDHRAAAKQCSCPGSRSNYRTHPRDRGWYRNRARYKELDGSMERCG
jgi:hypothetical protein